MNLTNDKKTSYNMQELQNLKLEFCHSEVIENLKNDCEDFIKIFSIISLDNLNSIEEAELLFLHLTDHSTPIREITALKLEEIYQDKHFNNFIKEQFLKAIIDINPNVCRAICNIVNKSNFLKEELFDNLTKNIILLLDEIKESNEKLGGFYDDALKIRKNHAKNKKLFSLYWYLEVLSLCLKREDNSKALEIVKETIKFNDYTIREKATKILINIANSPINLLKLAKNDPNFYVKNLVYDKINFEIDKRN